MYSATLDKEIRPVCRKFCQDPMEIFVDDDTKLTLHGLQQYFVRLEESQKNRKLNDLLDALEFNQVVIFVSKVGDPHTCRRPARVPPSRRSHPSLLFLTVSFLYSPIFSFGYRTLDVFQVNRAVELNRILEECNFPSIVIHAGLKQEERIARFKSFKVR